MLATAVIVLREVLEAALVVSIVLAATRGVVGRGAWISYGIVAGTLGALAVAAFADAISAAASGLGQEIFNATVLFIAVAMLGWHNVWMTRHGREMAANLKSVGTAVRVGDKPLYALSIVVTMAVLREGSELVLFLRHRFGWARSDNRAGSRVCAWAGRGIDACSRHVFRTAARTCQTSICRDWMVDPAARRRYGCPRRCLPRAGRHSAGTG